MRLFFLNFTRVLFFIPAIICCALFLSSCKTFKDVFADQYISLRTNNEISKNEKSESKISSSIKISVKSNVNDGDLIGFRIQSNINNRVGQGKVFIKNNPVIAIAQIAKEYAVSKGFKIASNSYDKDLQLKLMYLDYRAKGGGLSVGIICNMAIKATIYDAQGKLLYKKWYFISKEFDRYHYSEAKVTENNINESLDQIMQNIFSDHEMMIKLKK